jgi:hypothetical protein
MWAAQKPVLLQTEWLRSEPAKIEPSGKIKIIPNKPGAYPVKNRKKYVRRVWHNYLIEEMKN